MFFECNEFNATAVAELLRLQGFTDVELRKDLAGADRLLLGRMFDSPALSSTLAI